MARAVTPASRRTHSAAPGKITWPMAEQRLEAATLVGDQLSDLLVPEDDI